MESNKMIWTEAEMEAVELKAEDVITASREPGEGELDWSEAEFAGWFFCGITFLDISHLQVLQGTKGSILPAEVQCL